MQRLDIALFAKRQLIFKINADIIIIKALLLLKLLIVTLLPFFLFYVSQNPDSILWNNVRLNVDIVTQQEH